MFELLFTSEHLSWKTVFELLFKSEHSSWKTVFDLLFTASFVTIQNGSTAPDDIPPV